MPSPLVGIFPKAFSQRSSTSAGVARDSSSTLSFDPKEDEKKQKDETKVKIAQCLKSAQKNALKQWS
ncbi:hypothetical protein PG996_008638 [Apiospora saccharicola]|uniref:Uncharacterized protein n=1 Tax=Apiospora saccharicola TaxID=335842 RepID=A0ABR1UYH6_9PEZI